MDVGEWTTDGEWTATPDLNRVYREIRALGIESNLAELEAFGFTVIRGALTPEQLDCAREVVLDLAEKRIGRRLDIENEAELDVSRGYADLDLQNYLLYKHSIFEEIVLNPKPLALVTYLLGYSCWLSNLLTQIKTPGKTGLYLHSDNGNGILHSPFPSYPLITNVIHTLTDYTREKGAIAMVPGSHLLARQPVGSEQRLVGDQANPHAIPIEVPAGSVVSWHPNTWHGGYPRLVPGVRISVSSFYCRQHVDPFEDNTNMPEEVLARHGRDSRLAQLVGLNRWNAPGGGAARRAGLTWHA